MASRRWRRFILTIYVISVKLALALEPEWHKMRQKDYSVEPHRVELKFANKSYFNMKQFELIKYNRSYHRVLNASGFLLKEVGKNFREYARNSFNVREVVKKFTNARPCPQKVGYFYVKQADYDESLFPPFIPKGDYKINMQLFHNDDHIGTIEAYGSIVDKQTT